MANLSCFTLITAFAVLRFTMQVQGNVGKTYTVRWESTWYLDEVIYCSSSDITFYTISSGSKEGIKLIIIISLN